MTAPTRIGAYRVERLLGAGSFATVWLAHDPLLDGRVAIKVLAENWSHDLRVRERFLDEARLLRRLDHDRLVRVHAVGELPDGRPYAVLAWADGGSLRDRLVRGPLPVAEAVTLLDEIAAGVAVLHRHGVVHRDLTPGNILFRSASGAERVLVADLGLAKALAAASGLTARAGTPGYMAPEQDDPFAVVDTRADVFGLGRLGLRLLGDAPAAPVRDDRRGGRGLPRLRAGVPPGVAAVLRTATAVRPADRYPDAAAFRAALRHAATSARVGQAAATSAAHTGTTFAGLAVAPSAVGPGGGAPRPSRRRLAASAAVAVLLVALGGTAGDAAGRDPAGAVGRSGPLTVALPAGWRADGTGWAGQYGDDGELEPALVVSPDPGRWAADPGVPGAFVGLSAGTARRTTPEGFLAERPHADCAAAPVRRSRQGGVDWIVAAFACPAGRPVIVEAAGRAAGPAGLLYVQLTPPPGSGTDFVDALLAGVRVG
ncbi:protein kinase [Micromonospora terminaliae]|uniref:non-specific serine/threonine protein kinase n=1 Tax=Micromonospora terminaliae TaxID=1914461 RepID=A0AAJ3DLI0_9ACTN|nr:serine/threonine-protein kinase [Micromonospora terminaliae]NES30378.1 serine/threonine protein kinase [Micromonospora terminaliae]QGL46426.1 protein kinase [Micromonospora terminaliae]